MKHVWLVIISLTSISVTRTQEYHQRRASLLSNEDLRYLKKRHEQNLEKFETGITNDDQWFEYESEKRLHYMIRSMLAQQDAQQRRAPAEETENKKRRPNPKKNNQDI